MRCCHRHVQGSALEGRGGQVFRAPPLTRWSRKQALQWMQEREISDDVLLTVAPSFVLGSTAIKMVK